MDNDSLKKLIELSSITNELTTEEYLEKIELTHHLLDEGVMVDNDSFKTIK